MKVLRKTLALTLCAMSAMSGLVACGGREPAPNVDDGKTQLYVKYYKGGIGAEWIEQTIADFETKYANVVDKTAKPVRSRGIPRFR